MVDAGAFARRQTRRCLLFLDDLLEAVLAAGDVDAIRVQEARHGLLELVDAVLVLNFCLRLEDWQADGVHRSWNVAADGWR